MSKYEGTIYPLDETELDIMCNLEQAPKRFIELSETHKVVADNLRPVVAKMVDRKLIWLNVHQAVFMITHAGVAHLRANKRRAMKFTQHVPKK